jgi:D-aminoacyl-tRNA deacylase
MIALVCSLKDTAGLNMFQRLVERGFSETGQQWQSMPVLGKGDLRLVRIREDIIFPAGLDSLGAERIVFLSRHKAESGTPTLTLHPTGNFGPDNSHGGRPAELSFTDANLMRRIYLEMLECTLDYEVSLEVTHHGPTEFKTPLCFVELGSSEKFWGDEKAASFLVDCVLNGLERKDKAEAVVGIGGNHYARVFSEKEKEFAFGHICPKYALEFLNEALLKQMVEKTVEKPVKVVMDKEGVKGKARLMQLLKGYEVVMA